MKRYTLRSKKSGNLFSWHEYCDDGWGEYHDDISPKSTEVPGLFAKSAVSEENKHGYPRCSLKDHGPDDVEVIEVLIEYGPVVTV